MNTSVTFLMLAGLGLYFYMNSPMNEDAYKKSLVDQIFEKYGNDPDFDADYNVMLQLDIPTLEGILAGTIQ